MKVTEFIDKYVELFTNPTINKEVVAQIFKTAQVGMTAGYFEKDSEAEHLKSGIEVLRKQLAKYAEGFHGLLAMQGVDDPSQESTNMLEKHGLKVEKLHHKWGINEA